jgi:(p)ppGpp synthase/HD superfamily hydrolase
MNTHLFNLLYVILQAQTGDLLKRTESIPRIVEAFLFSYNSHFDNHRKDSRVPYIVHPMDVASVLMKNNASEDVIIAGLLHDVVEDTEIELDELYEKFGEKIASLVDGISEPEKYRKIKSRDKRKANWKERKIHTIDNIRTADYDLKLLTCADKLSNIRDMINDYNEIGDKLYYKLNSTKEDNKWYYKSMLRSFESQPNSLVGLPMFNQYKNSVECLFGKSESKRA